MSGVGDLLVPEFLKCKKKKTNPKLTKVLMPILGVQSSSEIWLIMVASLVTSERWTLGACIDQGSKKKCG